VFERTYLSAFMLYDETRFLNFKVERMMLDSNNKLVNDIKVVLSDLELLVKDLKGKTSQEFAEMHETLTEKLETAKEMLIDSEQDLLNKEKVAAEMTDAYARTNTWKLVAIAAVIGFLIGYTI
jgi:ElaB/YqjD/DUF883 family membrane-anchored ribosome-binding protein